MQDRFVEPGFLEDIFSYHAPTPEQIPKYEKLRAAGLEHAKVIVEVCPPSADRTAAIRKVREASYSANASVALDGKG